MTDNDSPRARPKLEVADVSKAFRTRRGDTQALSATDLHARPGEFVTILGPSGCGKSTLFHIITGLLSPSTGSVFIDGTPVNNTRGHVSYMPQGDQLLPWRSIRDNVILGMEVDGVSKRQARVQASGLLTQFGLGDYLDAHPRELSGGMRQRAAFIRTMLFPRDVLLLDEPLGALDAQTRLLMQEWLLDVWTNDKKTVLFITHDVDEAVFLSDRVYVMSARPGRMIGEVTINLPRPRRPQVREAPEYIEHVKDLLARVRTETIKSFDGVQGNQS